LSKPPQQQQGDDHRDQQIRDGAKADLDAEWEPIHPDMEKAELGRKAYDPPQRDDWQNQPSLHSLPANALHDDPQDQGEEEQPEDKGDGHEMEATFVRQARRRSRRRECLRSSTAGSARL
jgi:hypothetical protein